MKKNVHTAGKSRKQKKIMLLILEFVIILLLAIALFITTKLSKIEKNKLDMNDVSINDDLSDETKEAMAHYKTIALFGLDNLTMYTEHFRDGRSCDIRVHDSHFITSLFHGACK